MNERTASAREDRAAKYEYAFARINRKYQDRIRLLDSASAAADRDNELREIEELIREGRTILSAIVRLEDAEAVTIRKSNAGEITFLRTLTAEPVEPKTAIQWLRKSRKLNTAAFGEILGVSGRTVEDWEQGRGSGISNATLTSIARIWS